MVEVVFVEPRVRVFAPAPVATFTVVAAASAEMSISPVPDAKVIAPLVEVRVKAPLPV